MDNKNINDESFLEYYFNITDGIIEKANKYAGMHMKYDNVNAWRTCIVLVNRAVLFKQLISLFYCEMVQFFGYLKATNGITYDNSEEKLLYEKLTFDVSKTHKGAEKILLKSLEFLKNITDYTCDNRAEVQDICIEFVDLVDEIIKKYNLKDDTLN